MVDSLINILRVGSATEMRDIENQIPEFAKTVIYLLI